MTAPPASFLATRRGRLTPVLLCAVQFLDVVGSLIMNVALPSIRRGDPPPSAATPHRPAANR